MAGNDLLLQALMGNQVQQDPALGAVLPRLQMAQAMMQQGMDSSPATKWQGIGRLAQALAGNYIQYKGLDDVQNIVQQRNADTAAQMQYMRGGAVPSSTVPPLTQAPPPTSSGSFAGRLGGAEGGKNPAVVNPAGFSGQYQFGAARLADPSVGIYTPAPGEDLKANQWKGTFNVPGFPDVKTHADFLANPAAQKAAFDTHLADIDKNIAGLPNATGQDPNGLRAVAHLGGVDGMKRFVSSGGLYDPADANGTRLSDYYKRFSGAGTGPGVAGRTGGIDTAGPAAPTDPNAPPPPMTGPHTYSRQEALDMMQRSINVMSNPHNQYNPALLKGAQGQLDFAKTLLGLDSYKQLPGGFQQSGLTGKIEGPPAPLPHFVQTPTGFVDTTGTHAGTYAPTPRPFQTPSGAGGAVSSGGQVTSIFPADNPGIAARKSAEAQGTATGTNAATTLPKMVELGHEADTAIGNIDYGMNQLHQAAAGGINAGYFAPWLATASAAGKSLGVDLNSLGIDPKAVGNVQSAQKTLGVVAGTILQNTLGKGSAITDAKIDHFIHTQPGIETDPQAIERVLGWARSQFTYNREMAMHAMAHTDPQSGMIPPGWQAQFYKDKGAFAPIYDPLSQEMKQPSGQGPAPEMPKATAAASPAQPSVQDVQAELRRRGILK